MNTQISRWSAEQIADVNALENATLYQLVENMMNHLADPNKYYSSEWQAHLSLVGCILYCITLRPKTKEGNIICEKFTKFSRQLQKELIERNRWKF